VCDASTVILYTSGQKKSMGLLGHARGLAAKALDEAGYEYGAKAHPAYQPEVGGG
jgi:hypothetical protein